MVSYTTLIRVAWAVARAAGAVRIARKGAIGSRAFANSIIQETADIWNEDKSSIKQMNEREAADHMRRRLEFRDEKGEILECSTDQVMREL